LKILLINQYAGAPAYGMEYRPHHLGREWLRMGHEVTIVGGTHSHLRIKDPAPGREVIDGLRYVWIQLPAYRGNSARRAVNILVFSEELVRRSGALAKEVSPDVVITSSTHPLDIHGGLRIARLSGAKLVHEVHDIWPLTLTELAGIPTWNPFVVLLQAGENKAYRRADRVVSMLPAALDHMRAHGLAPEKFVYVPNGVAVADWTERRSLPEPHAGVLARIHATGAFVVGYAGGFALSNELRSPLEASKCVDRSVHFVLIGDGEQRAELEREFAGPNVTFLPPVPKPLIPSLLDQFDVCYLGVRRSPLYRFGLNLNKLFDYMMAGKPIISAAEAANDPVTESGAGITVPPEDPKAVAAAIDQLRAESPEQRAARGARGRRYVLENHDYARLAERFLAGLDA
jgi:glycosyltransferase involved in cell wall biosynthesis